jgi:hypothetical protein
MSLVISSCSEFDHPETAGMENEGEATELTVQIAIPSHENNQAPLRSIGPEEENAIQTIDVLAFRVEDGKETFDYYAKASKATGNTEGAKNQNIKITAWTKSYQQRFVVITNAQEKISVLNAVDWKGTEKNAMLAELEFDLGSDNQWQAIDASNYTAFPMWGESKAAIITKQTQQLDPVSLLRMVAKINVTLTGDEVKAKFKLKSVRLYNTNTKGNIVPDVNPADGTVTLPTIPADAQRFLGPLAYYDHTHGIADVSILESIYLFETAAADFNKPSEATCLVVGGLFGANNTTDTTYYRVDFTQQTGNTVNYKNILRNHQYEVNITDVTGSGYDTPEEAFEAKAFNMEVDILDWADGDFNDVIFDGQYFLAVSKDTLVFSKEAMNQQEIENVLIVLTNYLTTATGVRSGWYIEDVILDAADDTTPVTWLTPSLTNGVANTKANVVLTFDENNGSDARSAKIFFRAGRLRYPVVVTQTTDEGARLNLYRSKLVDGQDVIDRTQPIIESELIFANHTPLSIWAEWAPSGARLVMYQTVAPGTTFARFNLTPSSGIFEYTRSPQQVVISPADDNPDLPNDYVGYSKIQFAASNGMSIVEREIILKRVKN